MDNEFNMNGDSVGSNEAQIDDIVDETPNIVNLDDVEEVIVDDDVPMDEDDEDNGDNVEENNEEESGVMMAVDTVEDMANLKLQCHNGPVYAVSSGVDTSLQRLYIVSGGGDDKAFISHCALGPLYTGIQTTIPLKHEHTDSVSCVALNLPYVSEDLKKTPRLAAVGAYDGAIVLYDPDTGDQIDRLEGPTDVEWLCFHPKGGSVLLAGSAADGTVWMFHIPLKKCLQVFVGHESAVTAGSFSPDGKWAITCSSDGTARIWAPKTGVCKHVFRTGTAGLTSMSLGGGQDNQLFIVGGEDGVAHVLHIGTKKEVASLRHYEVPSNMQQEIQNDEEVEANLPMSVEAVGFASTAVNPNWCATGGVDGTLRIWDLANNAQCRQVCRPPEESAEDDQAPHTQAIGGITRLKWHPSLPFVFTSYTSGAIRLWDARNGRLLRLWTGSVEVINDMDIEFFEDGKAAIISASDDKLVRLFDVGVV